MRLSQPLQDFFSKEATELSVGFDRMARLEEV